MGEMMDTWTESDLRWFNRLVLKYQDQAYTLAWYLFGGDEPAVKAVQAAVQRLYRRFPAEDEEFRLHLLQHVWQQARSRPIRLPAEGLLGGAAGFPWENLTCRQAQLLVLVSVMGLDYRQAARVTGCSKRVVQRELAAGYRAMGAIRGDPTRSSMALRESPSNL
jgi:hypothetical protein